MSETYGDDIYNELREVKPALVTSTRSNYHDYRIRLSPANTHARIYIYIYIDINKNVWPRTPENLIIATTVAVKLPYRDGLY